MLPIAQVFGFSIQTPPLAVIAGFAVALWLTARVAPWRGLSGTVVADAGFYGALVGLLAARAGYVALNWSAYATEPLAALIPSATALWPWSGWVTGLAFAALYLHRKGALSGQLPDVLAPGAAVFLIGLALAGLLNGDGFGVASDVPWAIELWNAQRHPVQAYEVLALLAILAILLRLLRYRLPAGAVALAFVAAYAFTRVFVDGFRADTALVAGLRVTQLGGLAIGALAVWLLGEVFAERR